MSIFLIVPWGIAAGLAYWKMETNASQLKKADPKLASDLEDDKDGKKREEAKKKIPTLEQEIKGLQDKITAAEEKLKNDADDADAKSEKETSEKALSDKQQEVEALKSLDKNGYLPVMSVSNLGWTIGIFLGVGLIGHFLTKQVLKMFSDKRE
jgi:hypothetical protein